MTDNLSELKQSEQASENPKREEGNWIWGGILIVIGAVMLVTNFTSFHFNNWWAIIIIALGGRNLWRAFTHFQEDGGWSGRSRNMLVWGGIVTLAGLIFLFNWPWGTLWPAFIIIIGVGSLLAATVRGQ